MLLRSNPTPPQARYGHYRLGLTPGPQSLENILAPTFVEGAGA
jgi:hypothetical protein